MLVSNQATCFTFTEQNGYNVPDRFIIMLKCTVYQLPSAFTFNIAVTSRHICMFAHLHISKTTCLNALCILPVVIAWSFSLDSATHIYFSILWMMSCFHTMGHIISHNGSRVKILAVNNA